VDKKSHVSSIINNHIATITLLIFWPSDST
jgi:hypothetical protein